MKYAFFSDIHANIEALNKLAQDNRFISADRKICLGDTFNAYQPESMRIVFDKVRSLADVILLGNHEAVMVGACEENVFREGLQDTIKHVRQMLLESDLDLIDALKKLPVKFEERNIQAAHASFNSSEPWMHVRYIEDLESQFSAMSHPLNILGHGHIPFVAWKDNDLWYYQRFIYDDPIQLDPEKKYIINVGSILGSRELREKERTYMVYDDDTNEISFYNLEAV